MKQISMFVMAACMAVFLACSHEAGRPAATTEKGDSVRAGLEGDSTIYGLACDGCTDTILVLLSDVNADPDTFYVLEATERHRVFGHPVAGDRVAVVLSPDGQRQASLVIDLEQLKGEWCYMVTPTLRERAGVSEEMRRRFAEGMSDSLRQRLLAPREYGFQLRSENAVTPIGDYSADDENSPAVYERPKHYREWHILNGQLVLSEIRRDTLAKTNVLNSDTAELVKLRRDSLVLRFGENTRSYYRKH